LPMKIAPAARIRSTGSESALGTKSFRIGDPEVEAIPATHCRSLGAMGNP